MTNHYCFNVSDRPDLCQDSLPLVFKVPNSRQQSEGKPTPVVAPRPNPPVVAPPAAALGPPRSLPRDVGSSSPPPVVARGRSSRPTVYRARQLCQPGRSAPARGRETELHRGSARADVTAVLRTRAKQQAANTPYTVLLTVILPMLAKPLFILKTQRHLFTCS